MRELGSEAVLSVDHTNHCEFNFAIESTKNACIKVYTCYAKSGWNKTVIGFIQKMFF